jgi:tetratricopeptide (TPR) repeat protein
VLAPGRKVFIAESRATSAQYLRAPNRRAYSTGSLATLLTVCGYEIVEWVETDGPFLMCTATPFLGESWDELRNGYAELAGGRTEDALACFREAVSSTRAAVRLEAVLGDAECRLSQRDGDGAIRAYFHARDRAPSDARPMAGLARIALSMGDAGDAAQLAEAALRLDPTDLASLCAHALIAERVRPDRAKGRWLIASNLTPDSFDIALHLAHAAAEDSDYTLSVWALERVRAYGEDHGVPMHVALASALLGAGRVADAQLEARMAQSFAPFDPSVVALLEQLETAKR